MKTFCDTHNLVDLITDPTCFKSLANPSFIDVMLTNRSGYFENSMTIETCLSDCQKMTVMVYIVMIFLFASRSLGIGLSIFLLPCTSFSTFSNYFFQEVAPPGMKWGNEFGQWIWEMKSNAFLNGIYILEYLSQPIFHHTCPHPPTNTQSHKRTNTP